MTSAAARLSWIMATAGEQAVEFAAELGLEYRVVSSLGLMTSQAAMPATPDRAKALKRLEGERLYIDSHRNNSREWRAAQLAALRLEARIVGPWLYEGDTP